MQTFTSLVGHKVKCEMCGFQVTDVDKYVVVRSTYLISPDVNQ